MTDSTGSTYKGILEDGISKHLAWVLPRSLVYWCGVRMLTHATTGKWHKEDVVELSALCIIKRWQETGDEDDKNE